MAKREGAGSRRVQIRLNFEEFELPPVQGALVLGRRAPIGAEAITRALEELTPGLYQAVPVEHPVIECVVIRKSALHKANSDGLIPVLVEHAAQLMEDTDALRVTIDLQVQVEESLEL